MRDGASARVFGRRTGVDLDRRAALSAGVLFIVATVTNVVGTGLSRSLLDDPNYLSAVSSHANRVAAGALLELVAAAASVGIAISLYPVLKRWGAGLALGSVVFRTAEAVMYMISVVSLLSLLALGERFTSAGAADPASFRAAGGALLDVREQAGLVGVFAFSVGGFLYYYLFYRSRLVPRWLSAWGIVAIILMLLACLLALFTQHEVTTYVVLALPIGMQEMVLAVWLIAKGFGPSDQRSGASVQGRRGDDRGVQARALETPRTPGNDLSERRGRAWLEANRTCSLGGSS